MDEATALLVSHCRQVTQLDSIPEHITPEEFRQKFNLWSESTTTSPSGRHLGHFRALFTPIRETSRQNTSDPTREPEEDIRKWQADLVTAHLILLNYAISIGHVYDRWKDIANVMKMKGQGNFKIHRLRVIHLDEADYNFLLGLKLRAGINRAAHENTLHQGQYGGRPGNEAQSLALLEEIKTDISWLSRRSLVTFDNDASSCYDRIIPSLASLSSHKFGIHQKVVHLNAETLRTARYRLKTGLGVSSTWVTHSSESPWYGTGQGSGNSPAIWSMISSILFEAHQAKSHGATFQSPNGLHKLVLSMIGFVDDSTGSANEFTNPNPPNPEILLSWMKDDAQLWSDLLWTSGGLLELLKCSFHILHFLFDATGKAIVDATKYNLRLRNPTNGQQVSIPGKSPSTN